MEHPGSDYRKSDKRQNGRRLLPLILLLLVLTFITSSIVGFILGRNTVEAPLGQVIDTVLLSPEDEPLQTVLHLSGRVMYSDGSPAAGHTLELHSDPLRTVSAANGGFLFPNVTTGEHTLSVLNKDSTVAAQRSIRIVSDSAGEGASIERLDNGEYLIAVNAELRVLEIDINLDDGELYIDAERFSYATRDGIVITPGGTASIKDGVVVTPCGNVHLPDGTIVFPGGSSADPTYIVQKDDTVLVDQSFSAGGIEVASDGTVTLADGTVIAPGGEIRMPDGTVNTPGDTGVIIKHQTVRPIGSESREQPDVSVTPAAVTPRQTPGGGREESTVTTPRQTPQPEVTVIPTPGATDSGEDDKGNKDTKEEQGELTIYAENRTGTFTAWEQLRVINLFYNRETNKQQTIAPGSSGYYLFRLENSRDKKLNVTLDISRRAGSPYLPLQFTLRTSGQIKGGTSGTLESKEKLKLGAEIAGNTSAVYRLDWEWPFEGRDEADTSAGDQGGTYTLQLKIHAEEVG
ncbi:carboxypeptidase-like regulatory domain-containing protein [Ruminococcus sp. OA3]|uniref:carboxypeptidase-like regulatory domain-containing protein n=1 Tax=Ruminococcus sp. OA3 TaxID=2914164 RepID=UPI001F05A4BC|nr:carboxypeptidase-like regulatory domain-containing protein [Ruminococcus sp. OA3]MCH1981801.1 carboxypeptidase-like regulatory domain-containing protein [Ruminococcus sp. OA3]